MALKKFLILSLSIVCLTLNAHENKQHDNSKNIGSDICTKENASTPHCGKTPTSVLDVNGRLWIVYVEGKFLKLVSSDDNGISFSPVITINKKPEIISADGENRPKIALGKNEEIYISWAQKTKGRYTANIRFSRSLDAGKTFSKPITINDDGLLTSHRYDSLSVMPNGVIYLIWLDKRDLVAAKRKRQAYNGSAIYYTVSKDSGETFSKNKKIADHTCECCRVITEVDSNGLPIVLWRHIFEDNIRDHAITQLGQDNHIQRVTFDDWEINACPHHGPDMTVDENYHAHLVWFTGKEGKAGLRYGEYNLQDKTLNKEFAVDTSPTASRPQIAIFENTLYLVWKRVEDNKTLLKLISKNIDNTTWSKPITIAESNKQSDHPQLINNEDTLLVTWWSQDKGMQVIELEDTNARHLHAFKSGSFDAIKQKYTGKDSLVVLWSLDCPPCFKEMALLKDYVQDKKLENLVLISTNGQDDLDDLEKTLNEFSLNKVDNWYFAGLEEQLRYEIDPTWYGELPRSYYFFKNGEFETHRGLLKQQHLDKWLEKN